MSTDAHTQLIGLLRELSVRRGTFTLASGRESDFYVDARQTALNAHGSALIAKIILERLHPDVVAVGGMTLGADPIASSVAALSTHYGRPVHGFIIRKEPKGHGVGRYLVGELNLPAGSKVCMVEDTTTTGGSLLQAINRVREAGYEVAQVMTLVDREEGAKDNLESAGYTLDALTTRTQLLAEDGA
ncbi:MAG: orotate phosphoribosyltransferase [Myxococcota bacterium]